MRQNYDINLAAQVESEGAYALCYRCHNRQNLLNIPEFKSFEHNAHVVINGVPCFVCHDPHGIQEDGNGDHSNLINFASDYVFALAPNPAPIFNDLGNRTGSCVLVCHGIDHDGSIQFTYAP